MVPENRFPLVRQTISGGGTDAISWYVYRDHNGNVSYKYEGFLKVVRRSRATLIFSVCVPMVKPQGVPENRFPPVRQTIPGGGTDAISWYVYRDHNGNVSYKYEGVLKVVRRSRATLIFSVGVLMVKPQGGGGVPENRFPPVRQTIPGGRDAISSYVYRDHVYRGQGQSLGIFLPNIFGLYITV